MNVTPLERKRVQRVIDILLWLIGRDIDNDNLLLIYGFTRRRPSKREKGSSRYTINIESYKIILWGFGMLIHNNFIGVFLNRHTYNPKIIRGEDIREISKIYSLDKLSLLLEESSNSESKRLLHFLFERLYKYELWVIHLKGRSYRERYISQYTNNYDYDQLFSLLELLARDSDSIPI